VSRWNLHMGSVPSSPLYALFDTLCKIETLLVTLEGNVAYRNGLQSDCTCGRADVDPFILHLFARG